MFRFRSAVVAMTVIVVVGCTGREASITSGYGDRVLAGQVTIAAGMLNSSPAGVRVIVGTTGMSAVLDSTGNFMFVGVPEIGELHFTRSEDGIDARLPLDGIVAPVVIELSASTASTGRRRSTQPTVLRQYEGLVEDISATSITVNDAVLTINADTVIRKGNDALTAADIHEGDRVHVKANGTIAVEIKLQNADEGNGGGQGGTTMTANGTVTATGATEIKVFTQPRGEVTVQIDADTVIKKQGVRITAAEIHLNDQVNSIGTRVDDHTLKARQIEVRGVSGRK